MPDSAPPPKKATKPSHAEEVKQSSRWLRGTVAETLADPETIKFVEDDTTVLKHHGIYQQYDRDTATARKKQKLDKEWQFMVRLRVPGGRMTPDQYLALDELAETRANATLRVTTRQTFQFHGVVKGDLHPLIHDVNEMLLTTIAACGDVVRNVMATPAPVKDTVHETMARVADEISRYFTPRTSGYHEIWVDGEKVGGGDEQAVEPIYGTVYLPRKFKIAIATPDDNSVDVLTNDVGIIAHFDGETLEGYTVCVGGGLGMTHNKPHTYPRLATPLLFVEPEGLIPAVEAIVKLQRDHGNRSDRKQARLKYVVDKQGLPWMRETVETYAGRSFEDPRTLPPFRVKDHMGWHPQGDGRWYLGLPIASGRITDQGDKRLRTGLRQVIADYRPAIVLTPAQDILLADIAESDRDAIGRDLRAHGVTFADDLKPLDQWALACPALPTCGLALTEAERVRQPIVDGVQASLAAHRLEDEIISLRITGCPNGCARPYAGDIGLVGRTPDTYALYVGGDFEGTRLNFQLFDKVAQDDIPSVLDPLFAAFAAERQGAEGFGDFCNRLGKERLAGLVRDALPAVSI